MKPRILVIDDEAAIRDSMRMILEYEGYECLLAPTGQDGIALVERESPDLVFLDIKMPGMDGLEVLDRIRATSDGLPVVMISGHATVSTAVDATKRGAFDFIEKPLESERVLVTVRNAIDQSRLVTENRALRRAAEVRHEMVGESAALKEVMDAIGRAAPTNATVLILGESGVGKELVARAIHRNSQRSRERFVQVNCAAIPEELIESELFGHEKGSFTGADAQKKGKIEYADGGTLFLDEVGELPLLLQVKLLRFLQERQVERVGGRGPIKVTARVIAATNRELKREIAEGRFREDLYYRLGVVNMVAPPLRDRGDDIAVLANHFLKSFSAQYQKAVRRFGADALAAMKSYPWPGNVRELENKVKRAVIMSEKKTLTPMDLDMEPAAGESLGDSLKEVRSAAEREHVVKVLGKCDWNITKAAQELGISRPTLHDFIKKHRISRS
jgi:two-component system, NtrC family, nitrogen regulation response regulator NtrX